MYIQVLTGDIANITNATVIGLSVVPATPPPSPLPPVVPPVYENATTDEGDPVIIPIDDIIIELPTIVAETTEGSGAGDDSVDVEINFVLPTEMRVTMEPQEVVSPCITYAGKKQTLLISLIQLALLVLCFEHTAQTLLYL